MSRCQDVIMDGAFADDVKPDTSKPPVRTSMPGYKLEYNEYIVYDPRQVRLRYLVLAKRR